MFRGKRRMVRVKRRKRVRLKRTRLWMTTRWSSCASAERQPGKLAWVIARTCIRSSPRVRGESNEGRCPKGHDRRDAGKAFVVELDCSIHSRKAANAGDSVSRIGAVLWFAP